MSARASYRWDTKRSSAFSRIEHVLKRIRSASSRSGTSEYPSDSSMPFMRSESCSFIWQPKVVTWKRFMTAEQRTSQAPGRTVERLTLDGPAVAG